MGGYAWVGPGCCKQHYLPEDGNAATATTAGVTKEDCAARCLAQVGGGDTGETRTPCSRFTSWEVNGVPYCRIHNGCLNAVNTPTNGIRGLKNKYHKGFAGNSQTPLEAGDDMTAMNFYAMHRNCLTTNTTPEQCRQLLTDNRDAAKQCKLERKIYCHGGCKNRTDA